MKSARYSNRSCSPSLGPIRGLVIGLILCLMWAGCIQSGYVVQAGLGQLRLWGAARPIDEVLADPTVDERTKVLLRETGHIVAFGQARGLDSQGNYRQYVDLDRPAVVWFMAASRPLAFEPKVWSFPIVGSFPYLGWFSYNEAKRIERILIADGWEVFVRPVRAFSTGGWFHDPVLSSMFSQREDAFRDLANVLLHELTHANVLLNDQSTFNESIASFVGDTMAEEYLIQRFGEGSAEIMAYRQELAEDRARGEAMAKAYQELDALYQGNAAERDKLARKAEILRKLQSELGLLLPINNAALLGFKTYNAGLPEFAALFERCGRQWPRFWAAIATLRPDSFAKEQEEDIGPVIARLAEQGCGA